MRRPGLEKRNFELTTTEIVRIDLLCGKPKVREHEMRSSLRAENVLWFQIPMVDL